MIGLYTWHTLMVTGIDYIPVEAKALLRQASIGYGLDDINSSADLVFTCDISATNCMPVQVT